MPSCWAFASNYFGKISGDFGSGRRCLQRASAAALLSFLRSGCCADFFPPFDPILRRNSFTGVVAVVLIYRVGSHFVFTLSTWLGDAFFGRAAVAPVAFQPHWAGGAKRPARGVARGGRHAMAADGSGKRRSLRCACLVHGHSIFHAKLLCNYNLYFSLFYLLLLHPYQLGIQCAMSKHQIQNYWGGFCTDCGGTGRSETGCQSCSQCNRDPLKEMLKDPFGRMLVKLSTQKAIAKMDDPDGLHTHICEKCRFKWQHKNSCINDVEAHTCRECGCEQWGTDRRDSGGVLMQCAMVA